MKHFLLLFVGVVFSKPLVSQVIFCPPGAEWDYSFTWAKVNPYPNITFYNEPIRYVRDSVIDAQPVKILQHHYFFKGSCDAYHSSITLIKQIGDTVFFRNANTYHDWQILYNFAAQPGDSWTNTLYSGPGASLSYSVLVDSVGSVILNNFTLKQLFVRYNSPGLTSFTITERFGTNAFLFNFYTADCDGPANFGKFLCYKDTDFGLEQFSSTPCDYATTLYLGLDEKKPEDRTRIYPDPAGAELTVEFDKPGERSVFINDVFGKTVLTVCRNTDIVEMKIDVSGLNSGIYFLNVAESGRLLLTRKIIKM